MNKPFLMWLGNKTGHISEILPNKGARLIEPFVGSGSVFMNTNYEYYHLADKNKHLINLYHDLLLGGVNFINRCESFFCEEYNVPDRYYQLREHFNIEPTSELFVYLNRHGFKGLCRYNQSGVFNVPFGFRKKPYFPRQEMLDFYRKMRSTKIYLTCADYWKSLDFVKEGDIVYCDPPYGGSEATYTGDKVFDQNRLILYAKEVEAKGATCIISNSVETEQLYQGADSIKRITVKRGVGSRVIEEIVVTYGY